MSYDLLVRKLYSLGFLPSKDRLRLSEEEREHIARIALIKLENGLADKLRKANILVVRPSLFDKFTLEDFIGELTIGNNGKNGKRKKRRRSPPKNNNGKNGKSITITDLLGIPEVEKKKTKKIKKASSRPIKRPVVIEPEPYKRDVFVIHNHNELPKLRRLHLSHRLNLARKIAKLSEYIGDTYNTKEIREYGKLAKIEVGGILDFLGIRTSYFDGEGRLIGLVYEKRSTKNGFIVTIEDEEGMLDVYIPKDLKPRPNDIKAFRMPDGELMSIGDMIVPDEAIYVYVKEKNGRYIAQEVVRPGEILAHVVRNKFGSDLYKDRNFSVLFISDTHVGSKNSIAKNLERLRRRIKNPKEAPEAYREHLSKVELVLVGGDLVDGVGVYPGQEAELEIKDPEKQYEVFGELFSPSPADVITIPGNHDPTTLVIPQPVPEYAQILREYGIKITQNPAYVEYDGFRVVMYHGRSMEDLVLHTPIQLQDVPQLMKRIALSNFFVPIYGGKESFRPIPNDPLAVVKDVDKYPHVFFMGHIHIAAATSFGPMRLVNGGTTQTQPEEKVMNIDPTPGRFVSIDLSNRSLMEISILRHFLHHARSSDLRELFGSFRVLRLGEYSYYRLGARGPYKYPRAVLEPHAYTIYSNGLYSFIDPLGYYLLHDLLLDLVGT